VRRVTLVQGPHRVKPLPEDQGSARFQPVDPRPDRDVGRLQGLSERLFLETPEGWKIVVTSGFEAPPGTPPPPRALVGAVLVDGRGGPPVPDAVVVIRGGKIDCAGTRAQCPVPSGVSTQDVSGLGGWQRSCG
jgi:hypothetical protein